MKDSNVYGHHHLNSLQGLSFCTGHPYSTGMLSKIYLLSPVLNILRDSACLKLTGRLLYDLDALHRKLSSDNSKFDLLVGLICPLLACLVKQLYSLENMENKYLGDSVFMTLYTRMVEW